MNDLMKKPTAELMEALRGADPARVKLFVEEHFDRGQPDFVSYMDGLLSRRHMKRQQVLLRANLPQKYGYKLLSGESHTTDRNKILRLCFAMELSLQETQRALKLYGMNELYPKNRRDVALIVALGRRQYDIDLVSEELAAQGLAPLYIPEE